MRLYYDVVGSSVEVLDQFVTEYLAADKPEPLPVIEPPAAKRKKR